MVLFWIGVYTRVENSFKDILSFREQIYQISSDVRPIPNTRRRPVQYTAYLIKKCGCNLKVLQLGDLKPFHHLEGICKFSKKFR